MSGATDPEENLPDWLKALRKRQNQENLEGRLETSEENVPADSSESDYCESCGLPVETKSVVIYENVGALFMRFHRSVKGELCKYCIDTYFWNFTGKTMVLGWWGIISFVLTPFILINNIFVFLASTVMKKPSVRLIPAPNPLFVFTTIAGILALAFLGYSFFASPNSLAPGSSILQQETCAVRLIGFDTYFLFSGSGASEVCNETLRLYSGSYQRADNPPDRPITCRETLDGIEVKVIDTSLSGDGGRIACQSLYDDIGN